MNTLKTQDKLVWYLRLVKLERLRDLDLATQHVAQEMVNMSPDIKHPNTESPQIAVYFKVSKVYAKALGQLAGKMGVSTEDAAQAAIDASNPRFKRKIEHFMSLGIAAIDDYVFANQTPRQIISDWTPVEDAWKAKRKETVPLDREGIDTVIKYPDGSEWVNLNKAYCELEGDAMGHCGNSATPKEGDTVLSYRTIEEVDGEQLWKPRLTFILDKNGLLGETKGRANQKPAEKYHDVIVDLLRQDFVKGIKGGGYEAENNFKLADLPQEVQEELIEEKPGLASIGYDYEKRGMTKDLLARMEGLWEETEVDFPEFSEKDNTFWHDTKDDLDGFLDSYGGDQATWVAKVLDGREHIDIDLGGHAYYQDEIFDGLSTDVQHRVGKWLIENYGDQVEEWKEENDTDYDGTDASDTMKIAKEYEIEEITDALYRAEMTGHEYGAEKEMHDDLSSWLKDLPNEQEWELSLSPDTTWEEEDAGTRKLGTSVETMIEILDNYLDDIAHEGSVAGVAGIKKFDAPYNGWQGFDEEAAKEQAEEQLYETGVLTNETP
jgi:hypothetical protein